MNWSPQYSSYFQRKHCQRWEAIYSVTPERVVDARGKVTPNGATVYAETFICPGYKAVNCWTGIVNDSVIVWKVKLERLLSCGIIEKEIAVIWEDKFSPLGIYGES